MHLYRFKLSTKYIEIQLGLGLLNFDQLQWCRNYGGSGGWRPLYILVKV